MGSFKVIYEDYIADFGYRKKAHVVYQKVRQYLIGASDVEYDKGHNAVKKLFYDINKRKGSYTLHLGEFEPEFKGSFLMLASNGSGIKIDGAGPSGAFGFSDDTPVILMYCLGGIEKGLEEIRDRFRKDVFIHEFIHYLDWKRTGHRATKSSASQLSNVDRLVGVKEYINNPHEFNAYYQEVVSKFDDKVRRYSKIKVDKILIGFAIGNNFSEFFKKFFDSFPSFYKEHVDSSYKQKMIKRVYPYYQEVIKPFVNKVLGVQELPSVEK